MIRGEKKDPTHFLEKWCRCPHCHKDIDLQKAIVHTKRRPITDRRIQLTNFAQVASVLSKKLEES